LRGGMKEMTSPSGSTLSILRRYDPSNLSIVPFERGDYAQGSTSYTHGFREIVTTCLLVVSNRQVAKITVHAHCGRALDYGNVVSDREAEPVQGEGEGAHLDSWLRDHVQRVPGQGSAGAVPFSTRNL